MGAWMSCITHISMKCMLHCLQLLTCAILGQSLLTGVRVQMILHLVSHNVTIMLAFSEMSNVLYCAGSD